MEKNLVLQEIIFSSSDVKKSQQISRWEKEGKLRKIAPRIYTSNLEEQAEQIIKRNIFHIVGRLYPNSLLSHRSAFEFKPTATGHLFITYTYTKKIKLPGITLHFLKGDGPLEGDHRLRGELFASQKARAFLENVQISKRIGPESKTLTLPNLEEKLEEIIRVHGEDELNKLRDKACNIAQGLHLMREFEKLNKMIGALLSTQSTKALKSPIAKARAFGEPYDPHRAALFESLFSALAGSEFKNRPDQNNTVQAFRNTAFYESYFSNYIEGTVFELEEAKQIINTGLPLPTRNKDSHDILGTYQIVSRRQEMRRIPTTAEQLMEILQERHAIMLEARKDKNPGRFKERNNRAGNTEFVDFKLVRGTLKRGFENYRALQSPFAKAAFIMFLVSEVHPFDDGNGRIARIMMNAELVAAEQAKILIPTVFREDYLLALKRLTKKSDPVVFIKMLQRAHKFSEKLNGEDMEEIQDYLRRCNAFYEHTEGRILKIFE